MTGRRADGYHMLDSLVAFADIGDRLTVARGDALHVTGPFAAGVPTDDTNLVRRALSLAGTPRAVTLEKHLPHPAGIGGGSSDAATVLRAVGVSLSTQALMSLGADVPVCSVGRAARMRGAGEVIDRVDLPALPAVLVNPGVSVPTGRVFAELESRENPPMEDLPEGGQIQDWLGWLGTTRNDMEPAASRIAPEIQQVLAALRESGAPIARMSGSGATCFGLWPSVQGAREAAAKLHHPDWWVRACVLT